MFTFRVESERQECRRKDCFAHHDEFDGFDEYLAARDVNDLVTHVKKGQGTVGALVMDEAVYDDIQELLRDLKHNPWKLFWKE